MDEKTRILVCGGRHFADYELLKTIANQYLQKQNISQQDVEIVSGHCQGADRLGEKYASEHGCGLAIFPAKWDKYGRAAGPIRNKEMIHYIAQAERALVIAFASEKSVGTKNTVALARKMNIQVFYTEYEGS